MIELYPVRMNWAERNITMRVLSSNNDKGENIDTKRSGRTRLDPIEAVVFAGINSSADSLKVPAY